MRRPWYCWNWWSDTVRSLLTLENVTYCYPGSSSPGIEGVSLELKEGEMFGVLGANGSGKSTLARLCCGLYLPAAGEVLVEGCSTRREKDRQWIRRTVGLVYQYPDNQFVAGTVTAEVAFGLENQGLAPAEIRRRVAETLDKFALTHLAEFPPHRLSGGEKRRLSLAAVWVLRPKILLLDEPLSMLNYDSGKKIGRLLQELRENGSALVWFTYNMEEAAGADRVLVLEGGRPAWQGRPKELLHRSEQVRRWGIDLPPVYNVAAGIFSSPPPVADEEEFVSWLWR